MTKNDENTDKMIFVKPLPENFVAVIVFPIADGIRLDEVMFADGAKELNLKAAEAAKNIPCSVRYDVSVFMREGRELRELIPDVEVFCYKPKAPLPDRIAAQADWLKENLVIDYLHKNEDYLRFIELSEEYDSRSKSCNGIAVDVLSDVAKYYGRIL
ncbi:MAG: hypothetical protein FWF53_01220 [Candidatus Azobacteroides sp.]|nr:hypothetical protein [Candidatus Azobacteroides sp.]